MTSCVREPLLLRTRHPNGAVSEWLWFSGKRILTWPCLVSSGAGPSVYCETQLCTGGSSNLIMLPEDHGPVKVFQTLVLMMEIEGTRVTGGSHRRGQSPFWRCCTGPLRVQEPPGGGPAG